MVAPSRLAMAGHPRLDLRDQSKTWMAGFLLSQEQASPAMTFTPGIGESSAFLYQPPSRMTHRRGAPRRPRV